MDLNSCITYCCGKIENQQGRFETLLIRFFGGLIVF